MITVVIIMTSLSIFMVIYHHVAYPIILRLACFFRETTPFFNSQQLCYGCKYIEKPLPYIVIVMPSYNEEKYIAEKIRNLACLDYPKDRFEVILAADGCKDSTVKIANDVHREKDCKDLNLIIKNFSKNRGKTWIINTVTKEVEGDIIAFTDVSSLISIDALKISVSRFLDPRVGAVNGNYCLVRPGCSSEEIYWHYQSRIKAGEEVLGSVLGAHGGFYLVRNGLVKPLPKNTINDDFIIPMRVIEQGYRVVQETRINVIELEKSDSDMNWHRRVRIGMGNVQQALWLYRLFHPKYRGVALAFFSGKGLRAIMPLLMIISFLGSCLLSFIPMFLVLAGLQAIAYGLALCVHIIQPLSKEKLLGSLYYLVVGHVASFIGIIRYVKHIEKRYW